MIFFRKGVIVMVLNKKNELFDSRKTKEYIKRHMKVAEEIVSNKRKSYSHEDMIAMLKQEGL